jgi:transcriptional regulator with XRE-family HTH domain
MSIVPAGRIGAALAAGLGADASAGPTMPRLVLAAHLRRLRARRGLSARAASRALGSDARLAALESGVTRCGIDDVLALCELYGVREHATRVALLELARQSHRPGWWQPYRRFIPDWFLPYVGAEQIAAVIRCYAVRYVPDLLQTAEYARAQLASAWGAGPAEEVDARVRLRLRRQHVLHRASPANVWTVLDETALRRPVGGRATMFRQIEHLLELCELPNVTLQILPLASAGHVALGGAMTLLRLPHDDLADVVYLEQLDNAIYPDRPCEREHHRHAMNVLATRAPSPARTPLILKEMISAL